MEEELPSRIHPSFKNFFQQRNVGNNFKFAGRRIHETIKDTLKYIHSINRKQVCPHIIKYSPYFSPLKDPKTITERLLRRLRCTHGEGRGAARRPRFSTNTIMK